MLEFSDEGEELRTRRARGILPVVEVDVSLRGRWEIHAMARENNT
jgi:hypothetical protein